MTSERTQPTTLYPELDEDALKRYFEALTSGDTSRVAPARAVEIEEARAVAVPVRVKIPGARGDELDGVLWKHLVGPRERPAVIMPSPWTSVGWLVYVAQATRFAAAGYNVLAYSARGFGASGGEVEVAGPLDVEDGVRAIDFLTDRIGAEPTKLGFLGDSYGSGISQLVAALDERERVHAVAALSTWGDVGEAFYENSTRHTAAVATLLSAAGDARLSERTRRAFDDLLADRNIDKTLEWAAERSPLTHVHALNHRRVPVFFAHAWHETLFPANQTLRMFQELTGPKRIDLSIGDHSGPEMTGMLGLPNRIWEDAHRFFAHHLKGVDNGIDTEGQVVSQVMWSKTLETRPTWDAVTGSTERLYLTGAAVNGDGWGGAETDGGLADKPGSGWSVRFQTGADTPATVADAIVTAGYAEMAGNPKVYPVHDIDRADAGVWASPPMAVTTKLRGIPRLHLAYTPSAEHSTLIAHLFDVSPDGSAHIVTHAPCTRLGGEPGQPVRAEIPLQATGYDVPAGHRLLLVVDARDPFYGDANQPRATIDITADEDDPSYLDIPLG
ncbi:CocE/NonD family hydrolase [Streptomyces sp. TLI_146]|uniref:CocE/NonD family hydrolase n=1 Tax=Streptomyces sp. TLI_146 TaxID=1938858 RepID=UPI000C704431|nr:CocE/NonD family hydrolase [Streptomyces sp. TLI_146]PKV86306.1 putative CocE/NonD family hydrolase [Streptomyces sp. TLI_146]